MNDRLIGACASNVIPGMGWDFGRDALAYWIDACQRTTLFLDVLRQRSANYEEHVAQKAPHVLKFDCKVILDGRELPRPVNYVLVRIQPPDGIRIDLHKRPFVIVDPRAGHGPGIGGFKAESEIGVALRAGHPCYFIGFLPDPMPGQTIEDIARAEALFLEHVIALHTAAEGLPAVIGNCQAGWAVMMLAAMRPELFGPVIIAGSPLSYWAGVRGENPMRYTGGLLGGAWLTALMGDIGNGKFDGAWLVANFENMNPANTLWAKQFNLYSKIDSEGPRYLEFERWWGGHVLLNADEMRFITDELFIGNKLATAELQTSDGLRIDLRNIRSPIVVFCSKKDNITPPPQALDWVLDLYESVDDIRAQGQTIVYAVHETIGHLGIFVSGSVAKKEHDEFASNIDLIDVLPPGLYEAVITPKDMTDPAASLITGNYLVRFESRTLADIRALGGNDEEDDRRFATVARVSDINVGLYRTFLQPWVKLWANEGLAEWTRRFHPLRLQYEMFSCMNPFSSLLAVAAESVREDRRPVSPDNPFWQAQLRLAEWFDKSLDAYREVRDHTSEAVFHAVFGSPFAQALAGLKSSNKAPRARPGKDPAHRALISQRLRDAKEAIAQGGPREAVIRALLYIRMPDGAVDERGFNLLRRMREQAGGGLDLAAFKQLLRNQFFMLLLDEKRAVGAIPEMLARDPALASELCSKLRQMIDVVEVRSELGKTRLIEVEALLKASDYGATGDSLELQEPQSPSPRRRVPAHSPGVTKHL